MFLQVYVLFRNQADSLRSGAHQGAQNELMRSEFWATGETYFSSRKYYLKLQKRNEATRVMTVECNVRGMDSSSSVRNMYSPDLHCIVVNLYRLKGGPNLTWCLIVWDRVKAICSAIIPTLTELHFKESSRFSLPSTCSNTIKRPVCLTHKKTWIYLMFTTNKTPLVLGFL